jgi:hypothetical protein
LIVLLVVAYLLALAALTAWRVVRLCTKHLRSSFYGMTREQLDKAITDEATELPEYLYGDPE